MVRGIHIGNNGWEIMRITRDFDKTLESVVKSRKVGRKIMPVNDTRYAFYYGIELHPRADKFCSAFSKGLNEVAIYNDVFLCTADSSSLSEADIQNLRSEILGNVILVD